MKITMEHENSEKIIHYQTMKPGEVGIVADGCFKNCRVIAYSEDGDIRLLGFENDCYKNGCFEAWCDDAMRNIQVKLLPVGSKFVLEQE